MFPLFLNLDHNFNTNLKSRVRYYVQEINKSQFEKELFTNEKKRTMNLELRDLLQTFVTVSEDIFRKINQKNKCTSREGSTQLNILAEEIEENELKSIFEYMIEQYKIIISKYKSKLSLNECLKYKQGNIGRGKKPKKHIENLYDNLQDKLESGNSV